MKPITTLLLASFLTLGCLAEGSKAGIIVSNFSLAPTTLSFDISGTLPSPQPSNSFAIFFVNPNLSANPGFALGEFLIASSVSFNGSPSLGTIATGNPNVADYFYLAFATDLSAGQTLSGAVTGTWNVTAFDPSQVTSLDVYWGVEGQVNTGTYLTTVAVPEPSGLLYVAAMVAGLFVRRRRAC